jgi:hypothetical protein
MAQPGIEVTRGGQHQRRAVAVLDISLIDHRHDQQAVGVGEYVALAPR